MVDTTDLKSVGLYARAGSSPAFRTIKSLVFGAFFCFLLCTYKVFISILENQEFFKKVCSVSLISTRKNINVQS